MGNSFWERAVTERALTHIALSTHTGPSIVQILISQRGKVLLNMWGVLWTPQKNPALEMAFWRECFSACALYPLILAGVGAHVISRLRQEGHCMRRPAGMTQCVPGCPALHIKTCLKSKVLGHLEALPR